jgi:hypothetical protein
MTSFICCSYKKFLVTTTGRHWLALALALFPADATSCSRGEKIRAIFK